jgi:hypothetical protein
MADWSGVALAVDRRHRTDRAGARVIREVPRHRIYDLVIWITRRGIGMAEEYQLHFQEGFSGETVQVSVGGTELVRFVATTRQQIGLAYIERLQLSPGETVQISIMTKGISESFVLKKGEYHVCINLVQDKLEIISSKKSPGYL